MEAIDFQGPEHQARHLARYIKCPRTIRAHCVNNWGRSPSIDQIKAWQPRKVVRRDIGEPTDEDAIMPRLGILPITKPRPVEPVKRPVICWFLPPREGFVPGDLLKSVARTFNLSVDDLRGPCRIAPLLHARSVFVRLMFDRGGWSAYRIGRLLGGRDHSTIFHSNNMFEVYARANPHMLEVYEAHRKAGWCDRG